MFVCHLWAEIKVFLVQQVLICLVHMWVTAFHCLKCLAIAILNLFICIVSMSTLSCIVYLRIITWWWIMLLRYHYCLTGFFCFEINVSDALPINWLVSMWIPKMILPKLSHPMYSRKTWLLWNLSQTSSPKKKVENGWLFVPKFMHWIALMLPLGLLAPFVLDRMVTWILVYLSDYIKCSASNM